VVNQWATWCGPCRAELPAFEAVQDQHRSVVMVFVNVGEADAKVLRYLADAGLDLEHVTLDPSGALPTAIGSYSLPTTVFYGPDGRQLDSYTGALSGPALIARMEDNGLL
jgi:thiol-disulfide isomerase/thioredoxin